MFWLLFICIYLLRDNRCSPGAWDSKHVQDSARLLTASWRKLVGGALSTTRTIYIRPPRFRDAVEGVNLARGIFPADKMPAKPAPIKKGLKAAVKKEAPAKPEPKPEAPPAAAPPAEAPPAEAPPAEAPPAEAPPAEAPAPTPEAPPAEVPKDGTAQGPDTNNPKLTLPFSQGSKNILFIFYLFLIL